MTDASILDAPDVRSETRRADGVDLHVVVAGPEDGPLVVALHGFPDFWYSFRHQIPALVEAGYRVLVPDQRGYNLSDAPSGLAAYRRSRLSADVAALIRSEGRDSAHVVGHDWGANVAWDLALRRPSFLDRLVVCNVPHPVVFDRTLRSDLRQLRRSWYVFAFQVPWLPERLLAREDGRGFERILRESAPAGTFTEAEFEHYRAAWREGSPAAMVNWYRAAARRAESPPRTEVQAPTLICWGEDDVALVPEMAEESLAFCVDGRLERFDASHWVHIEKRDAVTERVLDHLEG